MPIWVIVLICIGLAVVAAIIIFNFTLKKKFERRADEQQQMIDETKETITMLIIDKKKMKLRDAGLPKMVLEEAPKRYARKMMPIIKAKVGPRIMTFVATKDVFNTIPIKTNVKADVSGIYITGFVPLKASKTADTAPKKKGSILSKII